MKIITLLSALACFVAGFLLLPIHETSGMAFFLAGCLGMLAYSVEV